MQAGDISCNAEKNPLKIGQTSSSVSFKSENFRHIKELVRAGYQGDSFFQRLFVVAGNQGPSFLLPPHSTELSYFVFNGQYESRFRNTCSNLGYRHYYLCRYYKIHFPVCQSGCEIKSTPGKSAVLVACTLETLQRTVREVGIWFGDEAPYLPSHIIIGVLYSCWDISVAKHPSLSLSMYYLLAPELCPFFGKETSI